MSNTICKEVQQLLGRYVDGELSAAERDRVKAHLDCCADCRAELAALRDLVDGIVPVESVAVPSSLWGRIERRLDQPVPAASPVGPARRFRIRIAPWAIAAALVLAVGLGVVGVSSLETTAQASAIDFGVLLDALPLDAKKAFRKFLVLYDAKPTTSAAAKRIARDLSFDTPSSLPGGFQLRSVYVLKIGDVKGIAAGYDRHGEFLGVVFHPPMKHERFGTHESYPCVIGKQCGHKVQVGDWKLVHFTEPTTCHCLLSRLKEKGEIPAVMKALAPHLASAPPSPEPSHP